MSRNHRPMAAALTILLSFAVAAPVALADPPPHAPAHGWRKKHKGYTGYT